MILYIWLVNIIIETFPRKESCYSGNDDIDEDNNDVDNDDIDDDNDDHDDNDDVDGYV